MDLHMRHLRYYVAVAEELNFTRAAQRLHIAQQALSAQIKQLEQAVGVTLLVRNTRNVALTAAGTAFLADARALLDAADTAVDRARTIQRGEYEQLTLGFLEGAALTLTDPILSAFRQQHPQVQVELRQFGYDDPSAGLDGGAVDVAFVRLPVSTPELEFEPLFGEPVVAALPVRHRLARRHEVSARELLDEPLLSSACTDRTWNAFWELDSHRGGRPAPVVSRSTTLLEEMHKVMTGVGIGVTVASCRWLPFPGVTLVPIRDAAPSQVAVGWRRGQSSALVRSFVALARTVRDERADLVLALAEPDFTDPTPPPALSPAGPS
ncbi:LysR substrate-binding domain-containing protein [Nocardia sp. NPDC050718]|uniref:LysR substrate-binding domain-containing protein n=1 Tax=Nocardia sp. NPDC050718 TaxID=3155788 RepID=UPI0033EC114D